MFWVITSLTASDASEVICFANLYHFHVSHHVVLTASYIPPRNLTVRINYYCNIITVVIANIDKNNKINVGINITDSIIEYQVQLL